MSAQKGVVGKLSEKAWDGPQGQVILHSFQLQGNKAYFRTGKKNPSSLGITEGASVSFDSDEKGNVDYKSVRKLADGEVQRSPSVGSNVRSLPVSGSRDTYWEAKEARDVEKDKRYQIVDIPRMTYCGAQDAAVKVVELALANGGIALPAKKGAILDVIVEAVGTVAVQLAKARMDAPALLGTVDALPQEVAAPTEWDEE
jgi:hypothetical protein